MHPPSKDQQWNWLVPIALGLFIGLLGAIAVGKVMVGESGTASKTQFQIVLVVCLGAGGVLTPLLMRALRTRRLRKIRTTKESASGSTQIRSAAVSSSSHVNTSSPSVTSPTFIRQPAFDATFVPLQYRPPRVRIPDEDDERAQDALVGVGESIYTNLQPAEMVPRVLEDVIKRSPLQNEDRRFKLNAFSSEGAVRNDGSCAMGWTLYFVREDERLGCVATVTSQELSLHYASTTDVDVPYVSDQEDIDAIEECFVPPIDKVLRTLYDEIEPARACPLYVRVRPPASVLVYTRDAFAVADIAVVDDKVILRNAAQFRERLARWMASPSSKEHWTADDILQWYRHRESDNAALSDAMKRPGADIALRSGDRIIYRQLGRGLYAGYDTEVIAAIEGAVHTAIEQEQWDETRVLLRCLAYVPTASVMARLHSLTMTIHKEVRDFVSQLFHERRLRTHGAGIDPIDALNFRQLQAAMGREEIVSIALCAKGYNRQPVRDMTDDRRTDPVTLPSKTLSYEIRKDILNPLSELRLNTARVRVVTSRKQPTAAEDRRHGKSENNDAQSLVRTGALTAAWLMGAEGGDCEGMLTIVPLPVSAGVLYLAGSAAEVFAKRIRREGLEYTREDLLSDLKIRRVQHILRLHRAATYLKLWDPATRPEEVSDLMIEAYRHGAFTRAWSVRLSIMEALMFVRATSPSSSDNDHARNDRVDAFFEEEAELMRHPVTPREHRIHDLLQEAREQTLRMRSSIIQPAISFIGQLAIDDGDQNDADRSESGPIPQDSGPIDTTQGG